MNAETGRESPSIRAIGFISFSTIATVFASPSSLAFALLSTAFAQSAGIATSCRALQPASIAFQFMSTISCPFLLNFASAFSFMYWIASSAGRTFASLKNADCRTVDVRLPRPISPAILTASTV